MSDSRQNGKRPHLPSNPVSLTWWRNVRSFLHLIKQVLQASRLTHDPELEKVVVSLNDSISHQEIANLVRMGYMAGWNMRDYRCQRDFIHGPTQAETDARLFLHQVGLSPWYIKELEWRTKRGEVGIGSFHPTEEPKVC